MSNAKKIVISGGPHTGKTTLFEALKPQFKSATFLEEPATQVIKRLGSAIIDSPEEFCEACIDLAVTQETIAERTSDLIIQDRGLIDTVAYLRRDSIKYLEERARSLALTAEYSGAIVCEFVGSYEAIGARYESRQLAETTHQLITDAYSEFDIPVFTLHSLPIEERLYLTINAIETIIGLDSTSS